MIDLQALAKDLTDAGYMVGDQAPGVLTVIDDEGTRWFDIDECESICFVPGEFSIHVLPFDAFDIIRKHIESSPS